MKRYKLRLKKLYLLLLLSLLVVNISLIVPAWGLERPRIGEIAKLKAEGEFEKRLDFVMQLNNHKVDPLLVQKFKIKLNRMILESQGMLKNELDRFFPLAPPPNWQGMPSTGDVRTFALLIEFNDHSGAVSQSDIDDMLYGIGNPANFPLESLTEYYDRSSYGLIDLSNGHTFAWYKTSYNRSNVTTNDTGRENLIKEVLNHFDGTHDFSPYDNDGDGDIDYFIVFWAGPDTGWGTFWWGYRANWKDSSYTIDGKNLYWYSWQWESDNPEVVIHETGHGLGLPDLYDYNDTVGPDGGVGGFDMMDVTGDHNCFHKWMLDWLTPAVVSGSRQDLILDDSGTTQDCVLIWPGVGLGDIFSEFFIAQNRQDVENDSSFWFNSDGLSIWHIDSTLNSSGNDFEFNNSTTAHKYVRLMEADGQEEIETATCDATTGTCSNMPWWGCLDGAGNPQDGACQWANAGDLYNTGDKLEPDTAPSSDKYDGSDSCVRVWNIADLGGAPGAEISASFSTICNQPPVSDAGGPYAVECHGSVTSLPLDGSGSDDPDNDQLSFSWTTDCPGTGFEDPNIEMPVLRLSGCSAYCNVNLTVTDPEGDSDTTSAFITMADTTAPVITPPADVTIECDQPTDPSNTGMATATDTCDTDITATSTDVVLHGACPQERTIIRTWTATDDCDNSSSSDQIITVVDTTAPVIYCNSPPSIIPPDAPISFTSTATDNCDEDPFIEITDYYCYFYTKKGKEISKMQSCEVNLAGDTISILDSGGKSNNIKWTTRSTDLCGNVSENVCELFVAKP